MKSSKRTAAGLTPHRYLQTAPGGVAFWRLVRVALFTTPMTKPTITLPTIRAAVEAGEHAPQTVALCNTTGLTWAELQCAADPTRTVSQCEGRTWSDSEREWLLRLTAAGFSQSLIARMLQRPRSGVSYALQLTRGTRRVYPSTEKPVGRSKTKPPTDPPSRRKALADELLREQHEWASQHAAYRAAKQARNAARGRV